MAPSNKKNVIRVLHVDDDPSILEVSKQILMDLDRCFEFDSACSVDEASRKISTGQFDIVISDYEMPQKNGLQFLKELREGKNEIPFILFTGKGREEVVIQALNLGADHYVNKQGSPETVYSELAHLVSSAVEKHRSKLRNENDSLALHNVHDAIVSSDANFIITAWNKAAEELFGFGSPEVLQKKVDDVFQKIQVKPSYDELIRQLKTTGQFKGEVVYQNKNGQKRDGELNVISLTSENGKFLGNVAVCSDITERKKTEEALIESEKDYRNLINGMGESAWVIDFDGNFVEVNDAAVEMLGYCKEELLSLGIKGIDTYLKPEQVKNLMSHVASGRNQIFETVHTTKDGTKIPVEISSSLITYQGKQAVLAIARNIIKRKKAEEKLKASEEKYQITFEASMDALMLLDEKGFFDCNKATVELFRCRSVKEFTKFHPADLSPPTQPDGTPSMNAAMNHIKKAFQTGTDHFFWIHKRTDGNTFPADVLLTRMPLRDREVLHATVRDITELKKVEESLKGSEEKFRNLAEESPNMIFINLRGQVVYANKKCEEITGYSREEFYSPNFNFLSLNPPEYVETVKLAYAKHMRGEIVPPYEYVLITRDGNRLNAIINTTLIEYDGNKALLGIITDITEREKAKRELQESEERYRSLFEQAPIPVAITTLDGTTLDANAAMQTFTGYSLEELKKTRAAYSYENPQDRKRLLETIEKDNAVSDFSTRLKRKDDTPVDVVLNVAKINMGKEILLRTTIQDVTEHKKAEKASHESQQKFKALFSANPDAAVFLDTDFHVIEANSRFSKLFGYSLDEIKGKIVTDVIVPDDSKEESKIIRQQIISDSVEIVTTRKRKDGSLIPLFMSGGPVYVNEKVIGSVMVYKDLSDIITVQEELSKALGKAELLNEKLRVVGGLTRHDVRNKLSAVTGYAYILKKKYCDQEKIVDGLTKMEQAVAESVKIFDFAKMYEQLGIEDLTYINVETKIKEACNLFSGPLPKITNECQGLTVLADSFLRQLFYNFIDNTRKYGKKTTTIRMHYLKTDQQNLKLIYEDDGVGVPLENKPRLFGEGFSTGGSTGFGLFLTKKMMDVYGWQIEENGEPGKGVKFTLTIPKTNQNGKENFQIT